MIKYTIKMMKRNLFINLFVVIQIAVTLFLIVICTSSIMFKIEDYLPLRKLLNKDGKFIITTGTKNYEYGDDNYYTSDDFFKLEDISVNNNKIKEVYGCTSVNIYPANENSSPLIFSYTQNMIDLYTPDIKYGKWLNKADTRSDEIAAVVTYNTKYKVGDLVEFTDSVNHYNFRIIGMLDKTAQTINTNGDSKSNYYYTFKDIYQTKNLLEFYVNYEDVKNAEISQEPIGVLFVVYEKGLNDEEKLELNRKLYQFGALMDLSELNQNSIEYLKSDITLILPISLCILILTLINSVAVNAIQTKTNLKAYSIFFICGAKWKVGIIISLLNGLFTWLFGVVLSGILAFIFTNMNGSSQYIISFNLPEIIMCVLMGLLNIIVSIILPILIISKQNPRELLIDNK